ncbi:type II secretion system protein J [Nitratidesulfovibrio sp. SRB-5]|uniref:PulJ/GspJ family protein n=1 Tax=Nitratidesulfovibrio sp. SRB-5 TaxID=2872636 RepID=UPI001024F03D|nr:type II secretion system protein [Nitratidesulfovibrio sp. SRB-5]MBZ2173512.1 type II secretion system GspH family protein [Nitratidesulfovibrio sp. SRB-5]RXF76652.1 type II secretion system protein [Desulfovibrio sp. DS-1]
MNAKGFTLIEIIVVLMLVGMLAAVAGVGIATGARSFVTAREASDLAQEAQLAMDRLTREIVELVDIPANSSSTLLVLRNVGARGAAQFDRSIQYVSNARAIRIADGRGGAANGDTLIDNVTAFSLTYWQEDASSTSWAANTDARLLSAIDVDFTLTAPGGTTRQFVNRIVPRNNENRGGASPNSAPPSLARYDVCFVATAAAGNGDHPVVVQLRQFRDRLLLPWSGGRALVRAYYAVGPDMARVVAAHEPLRAATLAALTPVAALAGLAVHAPGWLVACVVLSALLVAVAGRALRRGRAAAQATIGASMDVARNAGQRGAVLLSTIVTILAFSVLAATMVPMMTGSMMGEISAVQGDQAYYLAESGFGAAGSMFLAAGDEQARKDLLETMDGSTYTLLNNAGSFTLGVEPYWYEVVSSSGNTLTTKAYGTPPPLPANTTGRIRVGTAANFYTYSNIAVSGSNVVFTLSATPNPAIATGADVFLSAHPATATSISERGNLSLTTTHAAAFPDVNGMFTIRDGSVHTGSVAYVYRRKTTQDNTVQLEDIRLVDETANWPSNSSLSANANITLEAYLRLHSTGTPPGGLPREVIYNVPIGWVLGGGSFNKERFQDTFEDLSKWFSAQGDAEHGHLGRHQAVEVDGTNKALDVTQMETAATNIVGAIVSWLTGRNQWSTIFFNWGQTSTNLYRGWLDSQGFLSYDLQFKTYASNQASEPEFFAGMTFRGRNNGNDLDTFGISLVRFKMEYTLVSLIPFVIEIALTGDTPQQLVPNYINSDSPGPLFDQSENYTWERYSVPAILLWERRNGVFRWLAYKTLPSSASNIVTYKYASRRHTYSLNKWPTLLTRLVEGQPLGFRNGGGADGAGNTKRINYGDTVTCSTGAKARVIGQPIVTSGSWSDGSAAGILVVANIDTSQGDFTASQPLSVDNVAHATVTTLPGSSAVMGSKTNYIRVYYADSGASISGNSIPYDNIRRSNARLSSSGATVNWIPDDYEQWTSSTDYFTIVEWDGVNTVGAGSLSERLGDSTDRRTIITSPNLLSPAYDPNNLPDSIAEGIAFATSGASGDTIYFDDFGLQLDLRSGKGFLPPIQQ